jgi:hypothetical protein
MYKIMYINEHGASLLRRGSSSSSSVIDQAEGGEAVEITRRGVKAIVWGAIERLSSED